MPIHPSAGEHARGYDGFAGVATERTSTSIPSWPPAPTALKGAPNVVLVLVDDLGFSDIAPFGGEIATPELDRLADTGYRFSNYRTASMCSPARAALLTGLNPHRAGFAVVAHADPGYPGATLQIADDVPTIAESFRAAGYATYMVGKWHLTKESLLHDAADKSSWPLQRGFDRYFGIMDGCTSLHQPHRLIADNSQLTVDEYPDDYYLTDDMTERSLGMIDDLRASDPDKPFFLYYAHAAVHAPLQAKPSDVERYRGAYERGWDHIHDERFRRQIALGLFPEGTRIASGNAVPGSEFAPWDTLPPEQQGLFARYMEVYAAMVDNIDQNLARLTDHLKRIGEHDNTIIAFTSDNGATGEGGSEGTRSYFSQFGVYGAVPEQWRRDVPRDPELIGGPQAFVHYPRGWAYASNTPFRYYKRHTFEGGVHAPLLISWPRGLPRDAADSGVREQFTYVTDLGLTLLELAGVDRLRSRRGRAAKEVDGMPFGDLIRAPERAARRTEQYVEIVGNRAMYRDQWKIVSNHEPGRAFIDDVWELYDIVADPAETTDLAAEHPDLVAELAARWHEEAWHNTVYPLDDDGSYRRNRPASEAMLEQPITLYPGTAMLERYRSRKLVQLRDVRIEASFESAGEGGVLVSHGDQGGGYVLFIEDGRVCFSYNEYGETHRVAAELPIAGPHLIAADFSAGTELTWDIAISIDGVEAIALPGQLQLVGMSPFTGICVGIDRGSPVDWELFTRHRSFRFTGDGLEVRYIPGPKAPYNSEVLFELDRAARLSAE